MTRSERIEKAAADLVELLDDYAPVNVTRTFQNLRSALATESAETGDHPDLARNPRTGRGRGK